MKSNITITLCLMAFAFGLNAQKIKVTQGDPAILKGSEKIKLEYYYDNLKVGKMTEEAYIEKKKADSEKRKPGSGEAWPEKWKNDRTKRYEPRFEDLFNKYISNRDLVAGSEFSDAKYTIKCKTTFIEPGYNVGVSRRPSLVNITFEIVETTNSNEVLAIIEMYKSPGNTMGGMDFDTGLRIGESYAKAGKSLGAFLSKKYLK